MVLNFDSLSRYEIPKMTLCYANSRYLDLEDDVWDFSVDQSSNASAWARNKSYSKGQIVSYDGRKCQSLIPSNIYEPGTTGTVLTRVIGEIIDKDNEEIVVNFNQTSTLSFRAYRVDSHNDDLQNKIAKRVYDNLKNRKAIFVEGIGFFIITEVKSEYKDGQYYKDVEATSAEVEIENKMIPYLGEGHDETGEIQAMSGTFAFRDLLTRLVTTTPKWTIGYIDNTVSALYRTFDDVSTDTNILSFMLEDMQDAYECVFVFDIINRVINVYAQSNYINNTNIHLTTDDLINKLTVEEKSDDIYTVLEVDCDDELIAFNAINPTYDARLYDFTYYLDEMSSTLRTKVVNYQNYIKNQMQPGRTDNFYYYATQRWMAFNNQMMAQCEKDKAEIEYEMYSEVYANLGATNSTSKLDRNNDDLEEQLRSIDANYAVDNNDSYYNGKKMVASSDIESTRNTINSMAAQAKADINTANGNVNTYKNQVNTWDSRMENVSAPFKAGNGTYRGGYFTEAEFEELSDYISEGRYSDKYVIYTDDMNWIDKCNQLMEVYERAREQMDRVSMPVFELNIDSEDFVFEERFEEFTSQLGVGKFVHIEIENNVNAFPSWSFGTEYSVGDRVRYNEVAYRCVQAHTPSSSQIPSNNRTLWEVDDVDIADMFLNQITVNYFDNSLKMRFGSRYSKMDNKSLFDETLGKINRTANSVSYMTGAYDLIAGNYNDMAEKLQNSRNLSMKDALSSQGQEIVINEYGLTGRKLYDRNADVVSFNTGQKYGSKDGVYDNRQVKLVNNLLAFTSDGWENCDVAIGELKVQQLKKAIDGSGNTDTEERNVYGINAKYIVGDMIIGNGLRIYDNKGRLMFGVNEATGSNGGNIDMMVYGADKNGNPITYGLSQTLAGTVFYDQAGRTSVINGDKITAGSIKLVGSGDSGTTLDFGNGSGLSGTISGETIIDGGTIKTGSINADLIKTGTLNADLVDVVNLKADNIKSGTIDAKDITVKNLKADNITYGTLTCNTSGGSNSGGVKLTGTIDLDSQSLTLKNIDADQITAGYLNANRINAGTITSDHIDTKGILAEKIKLYGQMGVYSNKANATSGSNPGGYFGYYTGGTNTSSTTGMIMESATSNSCIAVGTGGVYIHGQGTAGSDSSGYIGVYANRVSLGGTSVSMPGYLSINGSDSEDRSLLCSGKINCGGLYTTNGNIWTSNGDVYGDHKGGFYHGTTLYSSLSAAVKQIGSENNWSDRRLKNSIEYNVPDIIDDLRPVSYKLNEEGEGAHIHYGFIAQDIKTVLEESNIDDYSILLETKWYDAEKDITTDDLRYALRYNEFIPLLVDKCQRLQKQINEQQNKIDDLEERLVRLEALIN